MKNKKIVMMIGFVLAIGIIILLLFLSCSKEYKVELKVDSGVFYQANLHKGDTLSGVQNPVKDGYTFAGWYVDGELFSLDTPIDENMVLEARFTKNKYTITIDLGDGSSIQTKEIEFEDTLEEPSTPTRKGYKFLGWYNGEEKYDFNSKITGNLNIEAKWEKINSKPTVNKEVSHKAQYIVEHYLMDTNGIYPNTPNISETKVGESGSKVSPGVKDFIGFMSPIEEEITLSENDTILVRYYYERKQFTLEVTGDSGVKETSGSGKYYYQSKVKVSVLLNSGYELDKWSNQKQETSFDYEIGLKDERLKVTTKLKEYQITYELNGGKTNIPLKDKYTIQTKLSFGTPTKNGYDFIGWKINGKEIEGTEIEPNTYFEDITVEAIFKAKEDTPYTVELYYMDTTGKYSLKETVDKEITKGTTDELPTYVPQNKNGFESPKLDGEKLPTIDGNGKTVLKYYYERKQYPVVISYNEDEVNVTYPQKEKYYFEEEINVRAFAKEGYHLLDDGVYNYVVTEGENAISIESAGNEFTVNYYNEDGTPSNMESDSFVYGETYALKENVITKEPYTFTIKDYNGKDKDETVSIKNNFSGWATSKSGKKIYNDVDKLETYIPSKDNDTLNLYAVFETENYELKEPSINGYEFKGFMLNGKEISKEDYKNFKVEKDEEITTEWELVDYSITFDTNGIKDVTCTDCTTKKYNIESDIVSLPTPIRPGYTFNGWVKNGTDELIKEIPKESFGELTLSLSEKSFTANENTPYKIEYYYMDKDGQYPTEPNATKEEHGVTDSEITFTPEVKEKGFKNPVLKESATGEVITNTPTINGNGKTVLKYYYERKKFTLNVVKTDGVENFKVNGKEYLEETEYYFESQVTVTATAKNGYHLKESTITYEIVDGDNTVTIESEGNQFTVNYHKEDGTNSEMVSDTFVYGSSYSLKENTITKDDYTLTIKDYKEKGKSEIITIQNRFKGWSTKQNNQEVSYQDCDSLENYVPNDNNVTLDLYAVFEAETYDLEVPNMNGYEFKGFKLNNEEIPQENYKGFKVEKSEEITTEWNVVNYNIKYDTSGVQGVTCNDCNNTTYTIEDEEKTLPVPTKPGYTFNGWVKNGTEELVTKIPKGSFGEMSLTLSDKSFTAKEDTPYKVEYYYMDTEGHYKEEADTTLNQNGTTDTQVVFEPEKNKKGFEDPVLKESENGKVIDELPTIDGNGTTVLKYYYVRKQYTLTVIATDGIKNFTVDEKEYHESDKYYYEEEVNITSNAKDGYHLISHELLKAALTNNDKTETFTYKIDDGKNEVTLESAGNSFTVKYHDENGGSEQVKEKTYEEGITLDDITYSKDPYTLTIKHSEAADESSEQKIEFNNEFAGWATSSGSSDIEYDKNDLVIPKEDGEEINLYAVFETEKKTLEKLTDTEDYYFKDFEDDEGDIEESELNDYTISQDEEITAHWLEVLTLTEFDKLVMDGVDSSFVSKVYEENNKVTAYISGAKQKFTAFVPKLMPFAGKIQSILEQDNFKEIYIQFDGEEEFLFSSQALTGALNKVVGIINPMSKIHDKNAKIRVILDPEKATTKDKKNELDYTINFQALIQKEKIDESGTEALSVFNKTKPDLDMDSRDSGTITFRYKDPDATAYEAIFQMGVNTAIHKFFENEFVKNIEVEFKNGTKGTYDRTNLSTFTFDFNSDINQFGQTGNYNYPVSKLYADGNDSERYKITVKINLYVDTDKNLPTQYTILFAPVEKITYTVKYKKNGTGVDKTVTCTVGEECELQDVVNVVTYYENLKSNNNEPKYLIPNLKTCQIDSQNCMDKIELKEQKYVITKDLTTSKNQELTLNLTFDEEKLPTIDKTARGNEYVFGGWSTKNSTVDDDLSSIVGYTKKEVDASFVDEYTYADPGTKHTYTGNTTLYAIWWEKPYIDSISFGLYENVNSLTSSPKQTSNVIVNKNKKAFYIEIPENDLIVYVPSLIVKTTTPIKLNSLDQDPSDTYAELWSQENKVHIGNFSMASLPLNSEGDGKTWKASDNENGMFTMAYRVVAQQVPNPFSGSQFYHSLKNGITVEALQMSEPIPITNNRELGIADKFGCNGLACTPHYGSMASTNINKNTYFFFATDENIANPHTITYKIGEDTVYTIKVPNDSPIPKISDKDNKVTYNGKTYTVTDWNFDFDSQYATTDITIEATGTSN